MHKTKQEKMEGEENAKTKKILLSGLSFAFGIACVSEFFVILIFSLAIKLSHNISNAVEQYNLCPYKFELVSNRKRQTSSCRWINMKV